MGNDAGSFGKQRPAVNLLGGFEVRVEGVAVPMVTHAQRVLGYLGVSEQPQRRDVLAGRLWGGSSQDRAQASLRNALWHVRRASPRLVHATRNTVGLGADVDVDLAVSRRLARNLVEGEDTEQLSVDARIRLLERDLLPAWDDDWILLERERTRQLHIHGLEALSRALNDKGRYALAIEAAFAAVAAEPLRESARVVLIEALLAEGNRSQALRQAADYCRLLRDELGVTSSSHLEALVANMGCGNRDRE